MFLLNSFSFNMLPAGVFPCSIVAKEISVSEAGILASGAESAVGHEDTARVFSTVLGTSVAYNRTNVTLKKGDQVLVGQYRGARLPEGATELPAGATIQWLLVTVE